MHTCKSKNHFMYKKICFRGTATYNNTKRKVEPVSFDKLEKISVKKSSNLLAFLEPFEKLDSLQVYGKEIKIIQSQCSGNEFISSVYIVLFVLPHPLILTNINSFQFYIYKCYYAHILRI